MKRLAHLLAIAALGSIAARADDKIEFKSLFNGKDMTGWTYNGEKMDGRTETPDKRFLIVEGVIVAAEGKGIKVLNTAEQFNHSFQLKMEFRASLKSDSGVYIRGPQLQVRDFIRRKEHLHLKDVFKDDDWNELDITVRSGVTTTTVNGNALTAADTLELTVKGGKPSARLNGKEIAAKNIQVITGPGAVCKLNGVVFDPSYRPGEKGVIGLQAETGKFEFRNVRIREIK
jgi:hypothetical protein